VLWLLRFGRDEDAAGDIYDGKVHGDGVLVNEGVDSKLVVWGLACCVGGVDLCVQ
jgi:hypothetical protein